MDPINGLQTYLFGNTIEDCIISIFILVTSVFIARYAYRFLLQSASRWVGRTRTEFGEKCIARVCTLITGAILITGITLARNRLILNEDLSFWLTNALLISGQIVFLLLLVNTLPPLVRLASNRHLNLVASEQPECLQEQQQSVDAIAKHIKELSISILILIPLSTILSNIGFVPRMIWALPGAVILIKLGLCYRIRLLAKRGLKKCPTRSQVPTSRDDPDSRLRESVVAFFLNLFKYQLRVPEESDAEFFLMEQKSFTSSYTYELRVQVGNDLRARRMTIAPLGEESGSRSKCFYVIYDDHLVIKLPPTQIDDLAYYVESLRKEAHVVDKLGIEECVIPRVSVILKRIHTLADEAYFTPDEIEEEYIRWLTTFPSSQKYLKIGDQFAFFMDFSEYYFLEHVIEYIHDTKGKTYEEILTDSVIIWDLPTLETKYGPAKVPLFMEIGKVYAEYEADIKKLLARHDLPSSVSEHQVKRWFFIYLATSEATELERELGPKFMADLNKLLKKLIADHLEAVENYRRAVKESVSAKLFARNKASMEGLICNIVTLLARLRQKRVAMRDLKPDNLLVAGDPSKYPEFLSHSNEYKIGLIDVETAVMLQRSESAEIDQPPLGGTPYYATPSHFLGNDTLRSSLKDLANTFYLQDWHAIVVIIYKVVTGEVLFDKTAQLLPGIIRIIGKSSGETRGPSEIVEDVSQMFWSKAVSEFREKMAEQEERLRSVNVVVPQAAKAMFNKCVFEQRKDNARLIRECVLSQKIFTSDKNRRYLLSCSHEKLVRLQQKYAKGGRAETLQSTDRARIADFLQKLTNLKRRSEHPMPKPDLLHSSTRKISAYELLELMFHVVVTHMYRPEWRPLLPDDSPALAGAKADTLSQTEKAGQTEGLP